MLVLALLTSGAFLLFTGSGVLFGMAWRDRQRAAELRAGVIAEHRRAEEATGQLRQMLKAMGLLLRRKT